MGGLCNPKREVYSVMGYYVGMLTNDPRIVRKRATGTLKPRLSHLHILQNVPTCDISLATDDGRSLTFPCGRSDG